MWEIRGERGKYVVNVGNKWEICGECGKYVGNMGNTWELWRMYMGNTWEIWEYMGKLGNMWEKCMGECIYDLSYRECGTTYECLILSRHIGVRVK